MKLRKGENFDSGVFHECIGNMLRVRAIEQP